MSAILTTAWRLFLLLTILTGCFYPLLMTGIAQFCFPWQANGSMLVEQDQYWGSQWMGQNFVTPNYFWGRPSATANRAYNGLASGGSNLGPTDPALFDSVRKRISERKTGQGPIPADLVLASGSGLDPEISPAAAYYQMVRVANACNIPVAELERLIQTHTQSRVFGLLGEPRVNVLLLNHALDLYKRG
jgi:K+-transporting ATPase ATPase C chain